MKQTMNDEFVGIFFCVNGKLIVDKTPICDAEKYGDNMTHTRSHDSYWMDYIKVDKSVGQVPFDYYPRGRVIYDILNDQYKIFIDQCINNESIIEKIKTEFQIKKVAVVCGDDTHYVCKNCNPDFTF